VQVSQSQLVAVTADLEHAYTVAVKIRQPRFAGSGHRHPLTGDCMPVFHPSRADVTKRDVQLLGNLADEKLCPHAALFDPQEQKLAGAARLIGSDFFDFEIFGDCLDAPANAGKIACEQGRRQHARQVH
jgi:hypothetical protein